MKTDLGLMEFREINIRRCASAFWSLESRTPTDLACATAGEVGEACNLIYKRFARNERVDVRDIADELADAFTYLDLLAARMGVDLAEAVVRKFNVVSDRRDCPIKLERLRDHVPPR